MATGEGDGELMRDLICSNQSRPASGKSSSSGSFSLTVTTGNLPKAGLSKSDAQITVIDKSGNSSGKLVLKNSARSSPMSEGNTHTFSLKTRRADQLDLGNLETIEIQVSERNVQWYVEKVVLETENSKYRVVFLKMSYFGVK